MSWDLVLKLDLRFSVLAGLVNSAQDSRKNANARRNLFSVQSKHTLKSHVICYNKFYNFQDSKLLMQIIK